MKVETITDVVVQDEGFERVLQSVDLVCVTDLDRNSLVSTPLFFGLFYPFQLIIKASNQWPLQKTSETLLCWWHIWTLGIHFL